MLADRVQETAEKVIANIERVLIGKREAVRQVLIAALSGGHVLLEDVPGVGKTLLVKALAKSLDCSFNRIQFTPDLLPSDITGISWYHPKKGEFEFREGPIMAHIVLADEINRTSPRTQSALLETMEEKKVTVDGTTYRLPQPFMILATQNPLDYEGTYPLPEAQMDRFLMRVKLGYPEPQHELQMLQTRSELYTIERLKPVLLLEEWMQLQQHVSSVYVDVSLLQYIVAFVQATRHRDGIRLGASPRASLALMRASQAAALLDGRRYVIPDDILSQLEPVLAHRLVQNSSALLEGDRDRVLNLIDCLLAEVSLPSLKYEQASGGLYS